MVVDRRFIASAPYDRLASNQDPISPFISYRVLPSTAFRGPAYLLCPYNVRTKFHCQILKLSNFANLEFIICSLFKTIERTILKELSLKMAFFKIYLEDLGSDP